jgi:hypothetical protein
LCRGGVVDDDIFAKGPFWPFSSRRFLLCSEMDEVAKIFGADEKFDARLEVNVLLAIAAAGVVVLAVLYWLEPSPTSASAASSSSTSSSPAVPGGEANKVIELAGTIEKHKTE